MPSLTRARVAAEHQISVRHLRDLEAKWGIPILRAGRAIRYDDVALKALTDAMRAPALRAARPTTPGSWPLPLLDGGYAKALAALRAVREKGRAKKKPVQQKP